jgi:hypothetical protein
MIFNGTNLGKQGFQVVSTDRTVGGNKWTKTVQAVDLAVLLLLLLLMIGIVVLVLAESNAGRAVRVC